MKNYISITFQIAFEELENVLSKIHSRKCILLLRKSTNFLTTRHSAVLDLAIDIFLLILCIQRGLNPPQFNIFF